MTNSFRGILKANEAADPCRRRAMTEAELVQLTDVARRRPLLDALTVHQGQRKGEADANVCPEVPERRLHRRLHQPGASRRQRRSTMAKRQPSPRPPSARPVASPDSGSSSDALTVPGKAPREWRRPGSNRQPPACKADSDPSQAVFLQEFASTPTARCTPRCTEPAPEPNADPIAAFVASLTPEQRARLIALLGEREGGAS
jgi:hypothetical protein